MRNITFKTRPLVRLRHKDITYDSYTNEKWKVITDIIKDFESVLSAAKYVNTSTSNISKCCTKNNTDIKCICKGYYFRYV